MSAELLVEAERVTLAYGARVVLREVTFRVRAGEVWCVIGPNGAGKSTLLRAILGLENPVAGVLRLHPERARRDRIGFVPQRCDLNPALPTTVREFVLLGTVGLGRGAKDAASRLDWALERVTLGGGARRDFWTLSGGERQRALLARALVRRPSLLLLDEPTTHLDAGSERRLLELLASLAAEEAVTSLVVTHDERIAERYATHLAVLEEGALRVKERVRAC